MPLMPLSSTAWVAAAMAYWQNTSNLRRSDFSMYCRGSKSFTSAATLALVLRGVKVGDGPNAALARFQALPKGGHVVAHGGDAPQAGYHNSSHIARPPSTRMVSPVM